MESKMKHLNIIRSAIFSDCGKYRYVLSRDWNTGPKAMVIGLNPSTANSEDDDATIESLIRILDYQGYGGFFMTNVFAFISTDPNQLMLAPDPIGPANNATLSEVRDRSHTIICAWGNFKQPAYRLPHLRAIFKDRELMCLGTNKNGSPRHPLYMKATTSMHTFKI